MFPDKITPWQQHIYACGLIDAVRHIYEYYVDILENVQVISFGCLNYVKKYERDPRNRNAAIKIHGYKCMACGFDFEKVYGSELGKNFTEVHHTVPLYSRDEAAVVNPEKDMVCLCSNCHRMIHRRKNAIMTLDQLKGIIEKQRKA